MPMLLLPEGKDLNNAIHMTQPKAQKLVDDLNEDATRWDDANDRWRYSVKKLDGVDVWVVTVHDEEDEFLGYL